MLRGFFGNLIFAIIARMLCGNHLNSNFSLRNLWCPVCGEVKHEELDSSKLILSGFQVTVEKPKPKQLLRPITTGTNSAMNQSQFLTITCNSPAARENSRVHGAIGFGFASHWLKNWRDSFKPITKRINRNHAITFDSHLKTALRVKSPP